MKNNRKHKALRVAAVIAAALTACAGAVVLFFKREDIKRHISMFTLGVAMIFCAVMMCGTAAYAAEIDTEPDTVISDTEAENDADGYMTDTEAEPETDIMEQESDEIITGEDVEIDIGDFLDPERQPNQLTPPGNLTLVDDLSGAQTEDKQFITVQTKNGNYFYIIIDRTGNRENVYFLNLVDEYDLLQILQGEDAEPPALPPGMTPPEETLGEDEPGENPPAEPRQNNTPQLLIMLAVIAAIGGGAFYYFKVLRPKKQGAAKNTAVKSELDEFDFDPDEDELYSDSAEYDPDEDIPDFTAADEDISFDFGAETPESEDSE